MTTLRKAAKLAPEALEQPIPGSFDEWWDSDIVSEDNPFREDSPAYWA